MDALQQAELVALKRQSGRLFEELQLMRAVAAAGVIFGLFFVGYLYGMERKPKT